MPRDLDHQAVLELNRRREMERSSEKLLAALREEHPRIIAHLTRKRHRSSPTPSSLAGCAASADTRAYGGARFVGCAHPRPDNLPDGDRPMPDKNVYNPSDHVTKVILAATRASPGIRTDALASETGLCESTISTAGRILVELPGNDRASQDRAYWYRQGKDDGVEQERGDIVEWLRKLDRHLSTDYAAHAIEAGEHLK